MSTRRPHRKMWSFAICTDFRLKQSTGLFLHGGTILGLPGKIGNANTKPRRQVNAQSQVLYRLHRQILPTEMENHKNKSEVLKNDAILAFFDLYFLSEV